MAEQHVDKPRPVQLRPPVHVPSETAKSDGQGEFYGQIKSINLMKTQRQKTANQHQNRLEGID